ncbi:MAG: uroporphyrinogen-III synthase [Nitrospirae bacterium]|nr:MAG: uroporphyrinogen-III synthase [Nitrospirota bacterium]
MASDSVRGGYEGLRVVAFESRLADQMTQLIERHGGRPLVAPSMREVPLEHNSAVLQFGERLQAGGFAMVILLTGVGTRFMLKVLDTRWLRAQTVAALGKTILVVRGPKPLAVLREQGLQPALAVPEPNTWRDLVQALDGMDRPLKGMHVAVQEYGVSKAELLDALRERGAVVTPVPVYQWMLPEDIGPLTGAIRAIMRGEADVVLFTNAVQVEHVLQIAEREGGADRFRQAMERVVVSAVGPIVAERLRAHRLPVDVEPSHPKMGIQVKETGERAAAILLRKRAIPRN